MRGPEIWLLPLALFALGCSTGPGPGGRPNVLLVSIDTLRADALGTYGAEFDTSPVIDALAARGVQCQDATSPTSWTLPSHVSMLTGLSISAHGMCDERLLMPGWVGPDAATAPPLRGEFLGELLGRAGYDTAGFFTWEYLDPRYGFGIGFETYERVGGTVWTDGPQRQRLAALQAAGDEGAIRAWMEAEPHFFNAQLPTADLAVDRALTWLGQERRPEDPFFLFLHLFDVHDDYVAPEPFSNPFDPDYDGPIDGTRITTPDSPVRGDMPARDLDHVRARYLGEVAWVDHQVGRLLDGLASLGLEEDTLVVLTSDHGEEFYEHGRKTHRTQLLRESVHVPLIFSWPGKLPAGAEVDGPVGLVDLVPTIAALADVPGPAATSGRDLSAVLRGEAPNREMIYLGELKVFQNGQPIPDLHTSLRRGTLHCLVVTDYTGARKGTVYDVSASPRESGPGTAFEEGSAEMARFDEMLANVRIATARQRTDAPPRQTSGAPLDQAATTELGAMGYSDGQDAYTRGESSPPTDRLCLDGCQLPRPPAQEDDSQ
ncbi:MAG: sulfatase-like hydrolase/transferase [Planctomycetota bacterium]|nr:sulfatase-like hydrolase/transferase [Planctomycetota bacterium]